MKAKKSGYVVEPEKRVPVSHEVDVVVAGGGISGLFAALSAGKMGAATLLVDRFGAPGGNIGPGFLVGGDVSSTHQVRECLGGPLPSVSREFFERLEALRNTPGVNYCDTANIVSYLAFKMAGEAGVEIILSAYAAAPLVEGGKAAGLFIEGKSGRVAARSRVLVDATGDAAIAARAGAFIVSNVSRDHSSWGRQLENSEEGVAVYDESGLYFAVGNFDADRYERFESENSVIGGDDRAWADRHLAGRKVHRFPDALIPLVRRAWEAGEFRAVRELGTPDITVSSYGNMRHGPRAAGAGRKENIFFSRAAIAAGQLDMGDMRHVSLVEKELRVQAFETVLFLRKYVPGFERAYLLFISPFTGSRGGPFIEGEHTLSIEDTAAGRLFDDVIFRNFCVMTKIRREHAENGCDIPYRIMLPRGVDNLLVTGRGAAYVRRGHDGAGQMRSRPNMMALGQAAGTAAALCAKGDATPAGLDVKKLQRTLLAQGFNLGDEDRLRSLGLLEGAGT